MINTLEEYILKTKSKIAIAVYVCDGLVKTGYIKTTEQYLDLFNKISKN